VICDTCKGKGWIEGQFQYRDVAPETYRQKYRGCRGTGQIAEREFVGREALTWCISDTLDRMHRIEGLLAGKAHRAQPGTPDQWGRRWHVPTCGAKASHPIESCIPAPVGWPQCRSCTKRLSGAAPKVFEDAFR
jgi:hypothetical protein